MITSGLTKKEFSFLVRNETECPLYLPKVGHTSNSIHMLESFLERPVVATAETHPHYMEEFVSFLFETTATTGVVLMILLMPGYLMMEQDRTKSVPQEELQVRPPQIKPTIEDDFRPQIPETVGPIDIHRIVTAELREKIHQIAERADEIKTDLLYIYPKKGRVL